MQYWGITFSPQHPTLEHLSSNFSTQHSTLLQSTSNTRPLTLHSTSNFLQSACTFNTQHPTYALNMQF